MDTCRGRDRVRNPDMTPCRGKGVGGTGRGERVPHGMTEQPDTPGERLPPDVDAPDIEVPGEHVDEVPEDEVDPDGAVPEPPD